MLWYVAIIAALNLCLGYLWGAYLRPCPRCAKARAMGISLLTPSEVRVTESQPQATPGLAAAEAAPVSPAAPIASAAPATIESAPGVLEADETQSLGDAERFGDAEGLGSAETPSSQPARVPVSLDPTTGLVTREYAEILLSQLTTADAPQAPLTVALVELAPIDWIGEQPNTAIDNRVLCGVSNIVRQSLADDHTVARFSDQQFLLLVPDEDVHQATRRAEEMRQRVATTEFVADGRSYQTTVTCALAEASDGRTAPKLFEFLQEALGEAKRYGGNRTFMHDGRSPTPVVPVELLVSPKQLAI